MTTQQRCPKCQNKYTYFHHLYGTWRCPTCGTFVPYPVAPPDDSPTFCQVCREHGVDTLPDGRLQCRLCKSFVGGGRPAPRAPGPGPGWSA